MNVAKLKASAGVLFVAALITACGGSTRNSAAATTTTALPTRSAAEHAVIVMQGDDTLACEGLLLELEVDSNLYKFPMEDAEPAARATDLCTDKTIEQANAVRDAEAYIKIRASNGASASNGFGFSCQELVDQLYNDWFSNDDARYAAGEVGICP